MRGSVPHYTPQLSANADPATRGVPRVRPRLAAPPFLFFCGGEFLKGMGGKGEAALPFEKEAGGIQYNKEQTAQMGRSEPFAQNQEYKVEPRHSNSFKEWRGANLYALAPNPPMRAQSSPF